MDKFIISFIFALCFVFSLGYFLYLAYVNRFQEKSLLGSSCLGEKEILKTERLKNQVEYHLSWARHSGDKDRIQALEKQIMNLDLILSDLKTLK
jgi:hypothetical protein